MATIFDGAAAVVNLLQTNPGATLQQLASAIQATGLTLVGTSLDDAAAAMQPFFPGRGDGLDLVAAATGLADPNSTAGQI